MKLKYCTSFQCNNFDCDYCKECSHAIYMGFGRDDNEKLWRWEFNPHFGPIFIDKKGNDLPDQPIEETHSAWVPFLLWRYRFAYNKRHPLNRVYNNMKTRCYNNRNRSYSRYGGRGIKICDEWFISPKKFYSFAFSHGWDENLQIDRKNNKGDYEPSNCRFVTSKENNNNRVATKKYLESLSVNRKKSRKKVKNLNTGEIFVSATHAAGILNFHENAVRKAISRGHRCGGSYWEYI